MTKNSKTDDAQGFLGCLAIVLFVAIINVISKYLSLIPTLVHIAAGCISLVCFVLMILRMCKSERDRVLGIISAVTFPCCGIGALIAYVWGWKESSRQDVPDEKDRNTLQLTMLWWTACIVIQLLVVAYLWYQTPKVPYYDGFRNHQQDAPTRRQYDNDSIRHVSCFICSGLGRVDCSSCNGSGNLLSGSPWNSSRESKSCGVCSGTGKTSCYGCGGSGQKIR